MLETLSTGNRISSKEFRSREKGLVKPLLEAQFALREQAVPTGVIVGGLPAAGRGACVDQLVAWLDSRYVTVHAMSPPTDVERAYPFFFRYWERLPAAGRTAIFFGSWYRSIVHDRVWGRLSAAAFDARLEKVVSLERMLVSEGMLLRKFWLHLDRDAHRERLERLEASPADRWRLQADDWLAHARYDTYHEVIDHMIGRSHHAAAPWTLIDAEDAQHRDISAGEALRAAFEQRAQAEPTVAPTQRTLAVGPWHSPLEALERVEVPAKDAYETELQALQGRLGRLSRAMNHLDRGLVIVLEGQDAAGKGGSIRRLTGGLDSRHYRVHATSAPSPEERQYPWLWRFWRRLPRRGSVAIFDRSWYGRVLVERVEGFCSVADWERAYDEIRTFEEQLDDAGLIVQKFWLAVSYEEQLRRFEERESSGAKRHKLTDEDWRNREKWGEYEDAVVEMYHRTHRTNAPWHFVDADPKRHARLSILRHVCEALEARLGIDPLPESARL